MISRLRIMQAAAAVAVLGANRADAQSRPIIEVACGASDSSGLPLYANDLGLYKKSGLDVNLTIVGNSSSILPSVAGGSYDVGVTNVGTFAVARDRGIPVRLFASGGVYSPSAPTALLLVPLDSPVRTAADLNGKTIAVNGLKADISMFETQAYLDRNGADSKTMKYVEVPFPEMGAALAQHRIDCAFVIEPFLTKAKPYARTFADPSTGIAPRFQTSAIFATEAWLNADPDRARRFATAIRATAQWANGHHRESAAILGRYAKLELEVIGTMQRQEYAPTLDPVYIQPVLDTAFRYGLVHAPLSAADLIWSANGR
jgi:NitT/TauT family transport system substrate-binding protein